jgi:tetratricopeptide (TPR) repeat protein
MLTAAAALHAEAALRPRNFSTRQDVDRHLSIATGFVELGAPPRMPRIGAAGFKSRVSVDPEFRRVFFLAAITSLQNRARTATTDEYLANAQLLFPHDSEVLLLSGIAEEMRASGRLTPTPDKVRRLGLERAEVYLRESLDLAPDRSETRLRLGRVLAQRGSHADARPLLTAVAGLPDPRLNYLAALFSGGLEDAAGDGDAALAWYDRAAARAPHAQAPRLAASELRHRLGARQEAAQRAADGIGEEQADDPWWAYLFGEFWRIDAYVDTMREMARR